MLVLRCEECSSRSDDGRGWIAVIVDDEEEADVGAYVVTYCPACAKREFGFVGRLPAPLRRENTTAIPENPPRFVWARSGPTRSGVGYATPDMKRPSQQVIHRGAEI